MLAISLLAVQRVQDKIDFLFQEEPNRKTYAGRPIYQFDLGQAAWLVEALQLLIGEPCQKRG